MCSLKILVSGASFCGNAGGAALYYSLIDEIRNKHEDVQFTFLLKYPKDEIQICKQNDLHYIAWPTVHQLIYGGIFFIFGGLLKFFHLPWTWAAFGKLKAAYLNNDLMIDMSGISFSDDLPRSSVLINTLWFLPAFVTGIPIIKLSQSIGPFNKFLVREFAKKVLGKIDTIITRGKESFLLVQELLPNRKVFNLPDMAFCLKPASNYQLSDALHSIGLTAGNKYIVAGASYVVQGKMGKEEYAETFAHLLRKIYLLSRLPIVFVPHCRNHSPALGIDSKSDDLSINQHIKERIENEVPCHILEDAVDVRVLKAIIGSSEIAVGSRYHFMIAAMSSGVPAMTIGWSHKYVEMMELFNQQRFVINYQDSDRDRLCEIAEELWTNKDSIKSEIMQLLPDIVRSSAENVVLALDIIDKSKGKAKGY